MSLRKALLTVVTLMAVTLSGCTSEEDGGVHGFVVKSTPADPVTEPFVFEATVSGDSYEWDLGDGRAKQSGKTLEYVYGFTDGVVKPKLTVVSGGEPQVYQARSITLGTGQNQDPNLQMSVEWDWITAGESVTISGAGSTDPDGDPLLFSWFCQRVSGIGIVSAGPGHAHAGGGGAGFGSAGVDSIPAILLNGTEVPTPDAEISGDFCEELTARSSSFTEEATLRGAFAEPGIYKVTMLAKDPKTPSVPGSHTIYVAPAEYPRLEGPVTLEFSGSFQNGVPATLDPVMAQLEQGDHIAEHAFQVTYPLLGFDLDFNFAEGTGNSVTYHIMKPNGEAKSTEESSDDLSRTDAGYLAHGSADHRLRVYARQGVDLTYDATITLTYETDPSKIFEDPVNH